MMKNGGTTLLGLLVFALAKFHLAAAMNILFYTLPNCASTLSVSCNGINAATCCANPSPTVLSSVRFVYQGPRPCYSDRVYTGGSCNNLVTITSANGNACLNGDYSGARWFNNCRRRRQLLSDAPEDESSNCTKPNALFYKDDATNGTWVLKKKDVTDIFMQIQSVSDAEKVDWLTAHGATYESETQVEMEDVKN